MKYLAGLLFLVACEKSGPVEATPGSSTTTVVETPKPIVVDAAVATLPNDAAQVEGPKPIVVDDEERTATADKLTAIGDDVGDMSRRRPGADLNQQIAGIRDANKVVGNGGGTNVGTRGTRRDPDPPTTVDDKGPTGRISISKKQGFDDTSLTPDLVLRKMQSAYMTGIKRCYRTYLKKDGAARGKLKLSFTVHPTGRTESAKAVGFAPEIDGCLSSMMPGWRFPGPKDKDGEATEAAFAFELQLVPD